MYCVDLGESFPPSIWLEKSASIQPRMSRVKFARSPCTDPIIIIIITNPPGRRRKSSASRCWSRKDSVRLSYDADEFFFVASKRSFENSDEFSWQRLHGSRDGPPHLSENNSILDVSDLLRCGRECRRIIRVTQVSAGRSAACRSSAASSRKRCRTRAPRHLHFRVLTCAAHDLLS